MILTHRYLNDFKTDQCLQLQKKEGIPQFYSWGKKKIWLLASYTYCMDDGYRIMLED